MRRHVRLGPLTDIFSAKSRVHFAPESDRKSGHAESFTGLILVGSSQDCCRCRYLVALSIDFELSLADRQA